jgi:hypothetical protein
VAAGQPLGMTSLSPWMHDASGVACVTSKLASRTVDSSISVDDLVSGSSVTFR